MKIYFLVLVNKAMENTIINEKLNKINDPLLKYLYKRFCEVECNPIIVDFVYEAKVPKSELETQE